MRLKVSTPTALIEDVHDIRHVRAEDETGAFGIMPGHAEFVTVLPVSVVSWRNAQGAEGFVLVRQGVMTVRGGALVEIAARDGFRSDQLPALGQSIWDSLRRSDEVEDVSRTSDAKLHLATIRQIEKVLRAARGAQALPPRLSGATDAEPSDTER